MFSSGFEWVRRVSRALEWFRGVPSGLGMCRWAQRGSETLDGFRGIQKGLEGFGWV